ncbi:MAG: MFS transporter [Sediminibacterium sp.]|nr:MFS transporter [Sediminibacterium sp.]MBP6144880.1 MFS transporter [Sediminibacterium sp.]
MSESSISKQARRVILSGYFFFTGICFASWASRIPDIKLALGLTDAQFGGMLLFLPLGSFLGIPISGSLTARHGSNKMLKIASILYPIALVNIGWAADTFVWHLAIALFLFGMIGNLFNVAVNTQAVELAKLFEKSIISSFHGFWSLAGFVGGLVGSYFIAKSMTPLMQFLVILTLGYVFLITTHQHLLHSESNKQSLKKMWTKPTPLMFQFGLIALSNMICEGMMFDWSGVFYQTVVKVSESQRTIGYISFMACMTTGRMFADALINYWGPRKQLMLSGLLVTVGLVIAIIYPSIYTSTIGFMLVGFGVSSVIPTIYGSVGKSAEPGQASIALASVSSIGFFGFLIGPPIVGFLSGALGLRWAFLSISILGLVTFIQSYRLKKYL